MLFERNAVVLPTRWNCRELEAVWGSWMAETAELPRRAAPWTVCRTDDYIPILVRQSIRMSLLMDAKLDSFLTGRAVSTWLPHSYSKLRPT